MPARQHDAEGAALILDRLDRQPAAVDLDDFLGDVKTYAGA
jgi:hypothetical protein